MENTKSSAISKNGGEPAAEVLTTKRVRRPNVRLEQPYYDHHPLGHRKSWKSSKAAKTKLRIAKTSNVENSPKESSNAEKSSDEEEEEGLKSDVAIGSWKSFKRKSRGKRSRPSSGVRNWGSVGLHADQDHENRSFRECSDGESEQQGEGEEGLGGNVVSRSFEHGPSSPNCDVMFGDDSLSGGGGDDDNVETRRTGLRSGRNSGEVSVRKGGENSDGNDGLSRKLGMKKLCTLSPNDQRSFGDNGKLSGEDDNVGVIGEKAGGSRNIARDSREMRIVEGECDGIHKDRKGVKGWLNDLGLGKYLALFEAHEVDEEVLPFLTLDDLKDMGINAVGSRRRMYCSIQKLGRQFPAID